VVGRWSFENGRFGRWSTEGDVAVVVVIVIHLSEGESTSVAGDLVDVVVAVPIPAEVASLMDDGG